MRTTMIAIAGVLSLVSVSIVAADVEVHAGGATFPNPIYQQWITDFSQTHGGLKMDYSAKGSGAGIGDLLKKTTELAGSDAPMNDDELAKAKAAGGEVVEIPSVAGAVVIAYNLPGVGTDLKLSGPVVADMFLGKIKKWN